jgi:hypothetical protein
MDFLYLQKLNEAGAAGNYKGFQPAKEDLKEYV